MAGNLRTWRLSVAPDLDGERRRRPLPWSRYFCSRIRVGRAPEATGELRRGIPWRTRARGTGAYIVAQVAEAIVGVIVANLTFTLTAATA
jgi:hypothetical protein